MKVCISSITTKKFSFKTNYRTILTLFEINSRIYIDRKVKMIYPENEWNLPSYFKEKEKRRIERRLL